MNIHEHTFDAKTEAVIEKVRKLMALANGNDNEHQAEAAANKARELLEAYNLDMASINKDTKSFTPRQDQKHRGGLYKWQRDLWNMVAILNFCKYSYYRGLTAGSTYEHRLIGSKANVIGATIMAQYLQDTVDRLAKDWVKANRPGSSVFIKEAIAYREGVAERLGTRLWQLREEHLKEERAKRDAERARNKAQGVNTENALTIMDVISSEEDFNADHAYGYEPGTTARRRKERELREEAAQREADALLAKQAEWDAAHPEEAAKRKERERKEYDARMKEAFEKMRRARPRQKTPEEERRSLHSFREGYSKGAEVSLDRQMDQKTTRRIE
jgi:Protein of unknown function (DUF2786).